MTTCRCQMGATLPTSRGATRQLSLVLRFTVVCLIFIQGLLSACLCVCLSLSLSLSLSLVPSLFVVGRGGEGLGVYGLGFGVEGLGLRVLKKLQRRMA